MVILSSLKFLKTHKCIIFHPHSISSRFHVIYQSRRRDCDDFVVSVSERYSYFDQFMISLNRWTHVAVVFNILGLILNGDVMIRMFGFFQSLQNGIVCLHWRCYSR